MSKKVLWFYHDTEIPTTLGRQAWRYYEPVVRELRKWDYDARIVAPADDAQEASFYTRFSHKEQFLRHITDPDRNGTEHVVCFWTSKPQDQDAYDWLAKHNVKHIFAELGWMPQHGTIHFDADGTGPKSSLLHVKPPDAPREFKWPYLTRTMHVMSSNKVGIVLQVESDWNMHTGQWHSNAEFLTYILEMWPDTKFLVRPHPSQKDIGLQDNGRMQIVCDGPLADFIDRCTAIVGMNSTSLLEALCSRKTVYQLVPGVGHESGAFVTTPVRLVDLDKNAEQERLRKAKGLVHYLMTKRQVPVTNVDIDMLRNNDVLGAIL